MAAPLTPSLSVLPHSKVSPVGFGKIGANTPSSRNFQHVVRNGRSHGYSFRSKAKMSSESDALSKDTVHVESVADTNDHGIVSLDHAGILCASLERSLDFYQNVLGLKINETRPNDKLPYRGALLWVGSQVIHLMELPNPDSLTGRPKHGGRDRHTCIAIRNVSKLKEILDKAGDFSLSLSLSREGTCFLMLASVAGVPYTNSLSGRPAIFCRDPDANALEFFELDG